MYFIYDFATTSIWTSNVVFRISTHVVLWLLSVLFVQQNFFIIALLLLLLLLLENYIFGINI